MSPIFQAFSVFFFLSIMYTHRRLQILLLLSICLKIALCMMARIGHLKLLLLGTLWVIKKEVPHIPKIGGIVDDDFSDDIK